MKLYAICWQDTGEPWGWAPATDLDGFVNVPSRAFFWDTTQAEQALAEHLDRLLPDAVRIAREHHASAEARRAEESRSAPGLPAVSVHVVGEDPPRPARYAQRPAPTEDGVRAGIASEWSIQEYDVPAPPTEGEHRAPGA
jgi:hypothetical protein